MRRKNTLAVIAGIAAREELLETGQARGDKPVYMWSKACQAEGGAVCGQHVKHKRRCVIAIVRDIHEMMIAIISSVNNT
jgi:hypothetical protein